MFLVFREQETQGDNPASRLAMTSDGNPAQQVASEYDTASTGAFQPGSCEKELSNCANLARRGLCGAIAENSDNNSPFTDGLCKIRLDVIGLTGETTRHDRGNFRRDYGKLVCLRVVGTSNSHSHRH